MKQGKATGRLKVRAGWAGREEQIKPHSSLLNEKKIRLFANLLPSARGIEEKYFRSRKKKVPAKLLTGGLSAKQINELPINERKKYLALRREISTLMSEIYNL